MEIIFRNKSQEVKQLERLLDFNEFLIDQAIARILYCHGEKRIPNPDDDAIKFFDDIIQQTRCYLHCLHDEHLILSRKLDDAIQQADILATKEVP